MPDDSPYTIRVPGIQDFIRIPPLEDPNVRAERIQLLQDSHSPLPDSLNWIPSAIEHIDTAEDLIYSVGLPLAWGFKFIAPDLVPYLGWAVAADQLAEAAMNVLAGPLTGSVGKTAFEDLFRTVGGGMEGIATATQPWMEAGSFFNWSVAASKTLYRFTGTGLNLGPVMAFMSDSIWGTFRAATGHRVVIDAPPPDDLTGKAARVLLNSGTYQWLTRNLDPNTSATLIAAQSLATDILAPYTNPQLVNDRTPAIADTPLPEFTNWNPASQDALDNAGFNPLAASPELAVTPFRTTPVATWIQTAQQGVNAWEQRMAEKFNPIGWGFAMQRMATEGAAATWDALTQHPGLIAKVLKAELIVWARWIELNVFPHPRTTAGQAINYALRILATIGRAAHFSAITIELLQYIFGQEQGGWSRWAHVPMARDWTFDPINVGNEPMGCPQPVNLPLLQKYRKCKYFPDVHLLPTCDQLHTQGVDPTFDPCPQSAPQPCTLLRQAWQAAGLQQTSCGPSGQIDVWKAGFPDLGIVTSLFEQLTKAQVAVDLATALGWEWIHPGLAGDDLANPGKTYFTLNAPT